MADRIAGRGLFHVPSAGSRDIRKILVADRGARFFRRDIFGQGIFIAMLDQQPGLAGIRPRILPGAFSVAPRAHQDPRSS